MAKQYGTNAFKQHLYDGQHEQNEKSVGKFQDKYQFAFKYSMCQLCHRKSPSKWFTRSHKSVLWQWNGITKWRYHTPYVISYLDIFMFIFIASKLEDRTTVFAILSFEHLLNETCSCVFGQLLCFYFNIRSHDSRAIIGFDSPGLYYTICVVNIVRQ